MHFQILFIFLSFGYSEACIATIPPDDIEFSSTVPNRPAEEESTTELTTVEAPGTSMATTPAAGAGGDRSNCPCPGVPDVVTQQFLIDRIKMNDPKILLPASMEPATIACGFRVECSFQYSSTETIASQNPFMVVKELNSDVTTILQWADARLSCAGGKWLESGRDVVAIGCYNVLE